MPFKEHPSSLLIMSSIVFYDIASAPPSRTHAPNPWKTRFALNLKGLRYRTEWVDLPDITAVREKLGVPANRTLPDGTPYHTLPVVQDLSTNVILGDSFEIALYLDRNYPAPSYPTLICPQNIGLTAALNAYVDGLFTKYAALCDDMPIDPRIADKVNAIFARRFGVQSPEDMPQLKGEAREQMLAAFEATLGELSKAYRHTGGTTDWVWRATGTESTQAQRPPPGREKQVGPYLDGDQPCYSDCIVGAWLKFMEASLPPDEWARVRTWQGGLWGAVVDGLEKWSQIR